MAPEPSLPCGACGKRAAGSESDAGHWLGSEEVVAREQAETGLRLGWKRAPGLRLGSANHARRPQAEALSAPAESGNAPRAATRHSWQVGVGQPRLLLPCQGLFTGT